MFYSVLVILPTLWSRSSLVTKAQALRNSLVPLIVNRRRNLETVEIQHIDIVSHKTPAGQPHEPLSRNSSLAHYPIAVSRLRQAI